MTRRQSNVSAFRLSLLFSALTALFASTLSGCGQPGLNSLNLEPLTKDQARADFNAMVNAIKGLYGPLEYKADHPVVKLDFEKIQAQTLKELDAAESDADVAAAFTKFVRHFRDGHAGIQFPLSDAHVATYRIPIFIAPAKDEDGKWRAVVVDVDDAIKDSQIKKGDEVVSVDGTPVFELLEKVKQYKSYSNDESDRHLIFKVFSRDFYMTDFVPTSPLATIEYKSPDDTETQFENQTWKKLTDSTAWVDVVVPPTKSLTVTGFEEMNEVTRSPIKQMGDSKPFFATDDVVNKYDWTKVEPTSQALKKFGIDKKGDAPDIYAASYIYKDKKVLLIRQPGYVPPIASENDSIDEEALYYDAIDLWIKTYKAIMWQNRDADVLVVDQTHNPGGISTFVFDFFRLFISEQAKSLVQLNNVDRKWIVSYEAEVERMEKAGRPAEAERNRAWAKLIEIASEKKQTLSDPVTFDYDFWLQPYDDFKWEKPMLVLADELAGSCGDIFPMLIKHNQIAPIFGERTMGLGGNVEAVTLPNSQATLRLTRGLFTSYQGKTRGEYDESQFVENNGIAPDTHYQHSLTDIRAGYVGYVQAFSDRALKVLDDQ